MKKNKSLLEKHVFSFVGITEQAALACFPLIGKGMAKEADKLAVSAMRKAFNRLAMDVQIVIGEGERDKAPRLYTGERLGDKNSSLKIDVAVDPLEGTNLCAGGGAGAVCVMAVGLRGTLFKAPDIYMEKIAYGPRAKNSKISLSSSPKQNIHYCAKALGKSSQDITVGVLDRSRHEALIRQIRMAGASVKLVSDGDLCLALQTAMESSSVDLLMGTGGAPEGVLAASALKCLGGGFKGRLVYKNKTERERAEKVGVRRLDAALSQNDLVKRDVLFFATGVTSEGPDSRCTKEILAHKNPKSCLKFQRKKNDQQLAFFYRFKKL